MPYIGQSLTEGTRREYSYVATAGQTVFPAIYTVGAVDVHQNGILLPPSDYTATDGTTVVFATGCAVDDEVVIHCHNTFSVADTYRKADTYTKTEADDRYVNASGDTMTGALSVSNTFPEIRLNNTDAGGNLWRIASGSSASGFAGKLQIYNEDTATVAAYIDSAGRVTMPYQPHFYVAANYGSHTVLNYTSPDWSVVYENNGGHFNTSTNLFTAPVNGRYFFSTHALIDKSQNSGNNYAYTTFLRNGTSYGDLAHTTSNGTTSYMDVSLSSVVYLLAGDTIEARYDTLNGARFYASTSFNSFTGYLLG